MKVCQSMNEWHLGNKENQEPQEEGEQQQNNSEEGKTTGESNPTGDVPQAQRQQSKTAVAEQVNQLPAPDGSRQQ